MPFHPAPLNVVAADQVVEPLPKIGVLHFLLVGSPPAVALPIVNPLCDSVANIRAVSMNDDGTGALQRGKCGNHGGEFHLIVGRELFAAKKLKLVFAPDQKGPPAAHARILLAGAVGPNFKCAFFCRHESLISVFRS